MLYSSPLQYLHTCERFETHGSELSFEKAHSDCYICDIKITPFEQASDIHIAAPEVVFTVHRSTYTESKSFVFIQLKNNKGPPAVSA